MLRAPMMLFPAPLFGHIQAVLKSAAYCPASGHCGVLVSGSCLHPRLLAQGLLV